MNFRTFALVFALSSAACAVDSDNASERDVAASVEASITPREVRAFGHDLLRVESETPIFQADSEIEVAGNKVYDLVIESPSVAVFRWQGSPDATADIEVVTAGRRYRITDALVVEQPAHPAFERMVSLGASFGQGVISSSFDLDGQLHAPSAQLARAAGAYFPLPLTRRNRIPAIEPEDFNGGCRAAGYDLRLVAELNHALEGFLVYQEERLQPWGIRIDPDIEVRNAAVGGQILGGVVHGALTYGQPIITLLEHLVYDPKVSWDEMLQRPRIGSELDYAEALDPTMVMIVDITGNDVLPALWSSDFDASRIDGDDYFRQNFRELFRRLGKDTWVFIADLPDITLIPDARKRRTNMINGGRPAAEVDAAIEGIRDRLKEINAILAEEAADYPRAVIVPFSELLEEMAAGAMTIGGQTYSVDNFGGFISLDGLHLTKVGYGVLADLFVEHVNKALGTDIPAIDLDAVAADDPLSPAHLAEYGLTPETCPSE